MNPYTGRWSRVKHERSHRELAQFFPAPWLNPLACAIDLSQRGICVIMAYIDNYPHLRASCTAESSLRH